MARRGRGEGTIRHRSDGRWEASVTLGVTRKSFYGKTRREVTDRLRAARLRAKSVHRRCAADGRAVFGELARDEAARHQAVDICRL
jgi:hypothetical protein